MNAAFTPPTIARGGLGGREVFVVGYGARPSGKVSQHAVPRYCKLDFLEISLVWGGGGGGGSSTRNFGRGGSSCSRCVDTV